MAPPSTAAIAANNKLAATLLTSLAPASTSASIFVAPPSVANALALLAAGAASGSPSEAQLGGVLGEGCVDSVAALAGAALSVPTDDGGGGAPVVVACANGVWAPPGVKFSDHYLASVARLGATARVLQSAADVNDWVSRATRGRIASIVPDDVAARAAVVLVNALYFKGEWAMPFDPRASRGLEFRVDAATRVTAHAMVRTFKGVPYAATRDVTAVRLPYGGGGTHEAVVALGTDEAAAAAAVLAAVDAVDAAPADDGTGWTTPPGGVALTLPSFSVEWGGDLKAALAGAGVRAPFAAGDDFAPMLAPGLPPPPPVSDVLHKVVVDVDERGTEAAAATAVVMTRALLAAPEALVVDRPFLFGVRHAATRAWLFVGRVARPAEWKGAGGGGAGANTGAPPLPPIMGGRLEPPGVGHAAFGGTEGRQQ